MQPPTSAAQATGATRAATAAPSQQAIQTNDDAARTRARLLDAQRELDAARAERAAADAEGARARTQMEAATRAMDSIAQARSTELTRAAALHGAAADAHLDYATKLVAARQAELEAADLHAKALQQEPGQRAQAVSAPPAGAPAVDPRLVEARRAADQAKTRAAELGQAALAAQRAWEDVKREQASGARTGGAGSAQ